MSFAEFSGPSYLVMFTLLAGTANPAFANDFPPMQLSVVAPDRQHLAWNSAQKLSELAQQKGQKLSIRLATHDNLSIRQPRSQQPIVLMPLRSLTVKIPVLQIMELPFLFSELKAIHAGLDGELGQQLRLQARNLGWEILAFWDEGLQQFSGNRRYNDRINLTGMEFVLLRPDPVVEKQFLALDAWTRLVQPQNKKQLLKECMVSSRAATLQQLWRERLDRVHLAISLTNYRYEGWVVTVPTTVWQQYSPGQRRLLTSLLAETTRWQRQEAQKQERQAQKNLTDAGMHIYALSINQRKDFKQHSPDLTSLRPENIDPGNWNSLLELVQKEGNSHQVN